MSDNFTGPADRIDNRYIIHEDTLSYFLRVDLFPHKKLEGWHIQIKKLINMMTNGKRKIGLHLCVLHHTVWQWQV